MARMIAKLIKLNAELKKKKEVIYMPDKDGKGPRQRSRFPSKPKGGRKQGNCK